MRIIIRLTDLAGEEVAGRVGSLDGIAATAVRDGGYRLACTLEPGAGDDPKIASSIIALLDEIGEGFEKVSRGFTVEDRFLEMTEKRAD